MTTVGFVTQVDSREVKTKFGVKPVYDIFVDGTKYSWGFKDPTKMGVSVGAEVEFDTTMDKYGPKVTETTVKVRSMGRGATPTPTPSRSAPTNAPSASGGTYRNDCGFPIPVTSEKISILRQNALTNAVKVVSDNTGPFGISEASPKEIIDIIIDTAKAFADYTSGRDAERAVAALTAKMEEGNA